MKKLATILMLIAAILIGGATIDAKTTKKKTSSSGSSLTLKTLTGKFYSKNDLFAITQSQITAAMKELGFTYKGSSSSSFYNDIDEVMEPATLYTYQKSGVTAEVYYVSRPVKITLIFGSDAAAKSFVTSSKKALGLSSNYYIRNAAVWSMQRSGHIVEIMIEEDMG